MQENVAAALCYALGFITGILFLVLEPYNKNRNIRFHAFQSIFMSVFFAIVHYVVFLCRHGELGFLFLLSPLISLAFFILWLFMMYKAYNNQRSHAAGDRRSRAEAGRLIRRLAVHRTRAAGGASK